MWSVEEFSGGQGVQAPTAGKSVSLSWTAAPTRAANSQDRKSALFRIADELEEREQQERNIAHATMLCEEAAAAAVRGHTVEAIAKFDQALFYRPNYGQGHEMRAQLLNEVGRTWEGIQAATTATTLLPDWAEAWITLARCQANLGEPGMALKSAERARVVSGDAALLTAEMLEWQRLEGAVNDEQAEQGVLPFRVPVKDPLPTAKQV